MKTKTLWQIPLEFCKPRVVILDDNENQIVGLREFLEQQGYQTEYFDKKEIVRQFLKNSIAQVLLIDASLRGPGKDKEGIEFAKECASISPEAARICISRKTVIQMQVEDVLNAMNPQIQTGQRILWAFGEKSAPDGIFQLIGRLRKQTTCAEHSTLYLDQELHQDWDTNFERIAGAKPETVEPRRQFVEIVKGLAHRPAMPEIAAICLEKIGKGRSRTLVAKMTLQFKTRHSALEYIIKIGAAPWVNKEVENYTIHVPQFLSHGYYPHLENTVCSRNLAGIAYNLVGRLGQSELPPTLGDLIKSGELKGGELNHMVENIFQGMVAVSYKNESTIRTLREDFEDRFHNLKDMAATVAAFDKNWNVLCDERYRLAKPEGTDTFKLPIHGNRSLYHLKKLLNGNVDFEPNSEAIVHGDLHVENVVFLKAKGERRFSFIDFSHTCPHNVFLDHIVMEVAARFQLYFEKFKALDAENVKVMKEMYSMLLHFEINLCDQMAENTPKTPDGLGDFKLLYDLICHIRGEAASRWPREPAERYLAGVGLASASAFRLKMPEASHPLSRLWLSIASAVSLTCYENYKNSEAKNTKISLWNYRNEKTTSERLRAIVESRSRDLQTMFVNAVRGKWLNNDIAYKQVLANLQHAQVEIHEIEDRYPDLVKILTEVFQLLTDELSETETEAIKAIGWAGLLIQLDELSNILDLPEDLKQTLKIILRKMAETAAPDKK